MTIIGGSGHLFWVTGKPLKEYK